MGIASEISCQCFQRTFIRVDNSKKRKMALPKAKEIVSSNPIAVFSKTFCPYCTSVKQLFTQLGVNFKAVELDTESDGSEIQAALHEWTGQKTVPNVSLEGNTLVAATQQQPCTRKESWSLCLLKLVLLLKFLPKLKRNSSCLVDE